MVDGRYHYQEHTDIVALLRESRQELKVKQKKKRMD